MKKVKPEYISRLGEKPDQDVASIRFVDMSELKLPIIALYYHPDDDPEACVARVWDRDKMTNVTVRRDEIWGLKRDIEMHTGMVFMNRGKEDVPCLVGAYV